MPPSQRSSRLLWTLLVTVTLFCGSSVSLLVDDVQKTVTNEMTTAWTHLKTLADDGKSTAQVLENLAQLLKKVPQTISTVERELMVYEYEEALKSLSKVRNTTDHWKDKWNEFAILTAPVDILYGHFKIFPDMPRAFVPGADILENDANSLADLILKPLYNTDEQGTITLSYLLEHAHLAVVSRHEKDAFAFLNDHMEESLKQSYWCLWNGKTPERVLYGFYTSLVLLDIKEYTLLNFAWMLRYAVNNTDFTREVQAASDTLLRRTQEKSAVAKNAISTASTAFWKCDPIKYVEGETYEQFTELLQGYIENEGKMHHTGSCKQTCADYTFTKARCSYPDDESCFKQRICTGNIVECRYIAADASVCLADAPRRFDYIQYKRGPTLGNAATCKTDPVRRDSYWRLFYHCSNCFCLCDDPHSPTSARHISLLPSVSDTSNNMVVTGVRFVMKNKIMNIQIEQGRAHKNGGIADGSTEWVSLPHISNKRDKQKVATMEYTKRSFDLDDLTVPPDFVVTGVRFRTLGSHVNLEVQATQINPLTGELIISTSHWISNDNTPESLGRNPRDELTFEDPDIPTLTTVPSIPDSVHDQYLLFGPTSRNKDVSQTTIPFIDIQWVRPNPPVWLQGVGVYHKGQRGFGGFVAPRVFTRSVAEFMREANE